MASTEQVIDRFNDLDCWDDALVLDTLAEGQARAVAAVRAAFPEISAAARLVAGCLGAGGALIYAGAGSSASIAVQDGSELPGTFGIERERIRFLVAGGLRSLHEIDQAAEDDFDAGAREVGALGDLSGDVVIAVSASGRTLYTLGVVSGAKAAGAKIISVANNAATPLLDLADVPLFLDTGPEVIAGSTRMGAGTAQKCALGLMSTLAAIRLGHVYGPMMVNLRAENAKLVARAVAMVAHIANIDSDAAMAALKAADGEVKAAVLIARGIADRLQARALLDINHGNLRQALAALNARQQAKRSGNI